MKITPYLHFEGNAEEALKFYPEAFGGAKVSISRYGNSPVPSDEDYKDKVIHGRIQFGENVIMISETFKGNVVQTGGNIQLSVEISKEGQIDEVSNKLAKGGNVTMELQNKFSEPGLE